MKKQTLRRTISAAALCCLLAISLVPTVSAATSSKSSPAAPKVVNDPSTLKVSPVRSEITIEPGATGTVKTTITNLTSSPIAVRPIQNDFVAGDENGTPSIILDENSYAPTHSLKRFMVPLKNVTVNAGESKDVILTITVPKSAQAGGYFGAVRYAPASSDVSKQVNLSASVASLVLLTVPGPVTEDLKMTNFDIQQNGGTSTNFRTSDKLELLLRFENKGNLQETPFGQIYVKKGNKVVFTKPFNQDAPKANVLPDSARRWVIPLENVGKFGKYTVGATFTHGTKNEVIEIEKTIWIVPTTYIAIGVGSLVGLILLITFIFVFLRTYKRRIMRSSGRYRNR